MQGKRLRFTKWTVVRSYWHWIRKSLKWAIILLAVILRKLQCYDAFWHLTLGVKISFRLYARKSDGSVIQFHFFRSRVRRKQALWCLGRRRPEAMYKIAHVQSTFSFIYRVGGSRFIP